MGRGGTCTKRHFLLSKRSLPPSKPAVPCHPSLYCRPLGSPPPWPTLPHPWRAPPILGAGVGAPERPRASAGPARPPPEPRPPHCPGGAPAPSPRLLAPARPCPAAPGRCPRVPPPGAEGPAPREARGRVQKRGSGEAEEEKLEIGHRRHFPLPSRTRGNEGR